jgi:hypothetical protein
MSDAFNVVSIHPYFKVKPDRMAAVKTLLPAFVEKSGTEPAILYYDFTINGDELFCREAYLGAEGVLAHLANVGLLLEELLKSADLIRLEVHGPSAELEKLRQPLSDFAPAWFVFECGAKR